MNEQKKEKLLDFILYIFSFFDLMRHIVCPQIEDNVPEIIGQGQQAS
jgi:hypothetical protein